LILQNPELERGCEVTSLAMLLNFNGLSVDKLELAENIKYVPFQNNGFMGNMDEGVLVSSAYLGIASRVSVNGLLKSSQCIGITCFGCTFRTVCL